MLVKKETINGVKWTSLSTIIVTILQILQISILARFLTHDDFGLMAILMVIIGFCQFFSDFGVSNAIIHHQDISNKELSSLYWFNIIISVSLFGLITLISPYISSFYNEPILTNLIIILSLNFIISSFGNQHRIILQKELKFNSLAKIEITSTFVSFIVSIILAIYDYGIYALIYATILKAFISSLLYIIVGVKIHKPSLSFQMKLLKPFLSFGIYKTAQSILGYFNSQFDVILIGKLLGTEVLGGYSLMKQLANRPIQLIGPIITKVTFPVLAKLQNDPIELKNVYLKTINYTTFITFPVYLLIVILAEPITLIMFGDKWIKSSNILQILAIFFMLKSTGNSVGSLVMATGKVHLEFWWNVGLFMIFPIVIYVASKWDIEVIAISLVILRFLMIIPMWFFMMKRITNITLKEYIASFSKPLVISLISILIPLGLLNINYNIIILSSIYCFISISIYIILNSIFGINILKLIKVKK